MPNDLAIEYMLNESDYASFLSFTYSRSRYFRKRVFRSWLIVALLSVVSAFALMLGAALRNGALFSVACPLLGGTLGYAVCLAFSRRTVGWRAKRIFRHTESAKWKRPARLEMSADGIQSKCEAGDSVSPWSAIESVAAAPSGVYLYYSDLNALIVPRSAFASDDAFQQFARNATALHDAAAV